MVHADAATLPPNLTKAEFYAHLNSQVDGLLQGQRNWVTNLSNAANLLYASLNRYPAWAGEEGDQGRSRKPINWAGFYILSPFFPGEPLQVKKPTLLLAPFAGLPACQLIFSVEGKGVCADASAKLPPAPVRVQDVDAYPGHIACDSASKSEIVLPMVISRSKLSPAHAKALALASPAIGSDSEAASPDGAADPAWSGRGGGEDVIIGVLDIDCEELDGFDDEDERGLTELARIIVSSCDW